MIFDHNKKLIRVLQHEMTGALLLFNDVFELICLILFRTSPL